VAFDWARWQGSPGQREEADRKRVECSERIWEQARQAWEEGGLDVLVSYCFSRDVELELVRRVAGLGVPWVNFFCDSLHMFEDVRALAREVSVNWFPETAARSRYEALGGKCFCRPYALNPSYLPELECREHRRTAGFVGFPSANRITRLGWLRMWGCRVEIRGRGWVGPSENPFYSAKPWRERLVGLISSGGLSEKILRRMMWPWVREQAEGELSDEAFFEFLRTTLVSLGLNQGRDECGRLVSYMKMRDLEFPGYGCCYLTERNEDVISAFEVDREVLVFASSREAAHWVKEMERHPEQARAIGRAGRRRVLEEHTWRGRLDELARVL